MSNRYLKILSNISAALKHCMNLFSFLRENLIQKGFMMLVVQACIILKWYYASETRVNNCLRCNYNYLEKVNLIFVTGCENSNISQILSALIPIFPFFYCVHRKLEDSNKFEIAVSLNHTKCVSKTFK